MPAKAFVVLRSKALKTNHLSFEIMMSGFVCWGLPPTTQTVWGVLGWSSLLSHQYNRGDDYKDPPPPKKFFLRPYRVSGDFCTGFKKRFGLYYIRVVTLGSVGGEGV